MSVRDIKEALPDWAAPPRPPASLSLDGQFARLERLDPERHAPDLFAAHATAQNDENWRYLPYGPFTTLADFRAWMTGACGGDDPFFLAIIRKDTGKAAGVASFLRIAPDAGSIEVGHLNFSPALQRSPAATEAMFLMMRWAFEAGYRRYEWKCDAANLRSRRAAERLGFSYEGVFRQATIVKQRNRDTAWFAAIDKEWPALKTAFETWLAPGNFAMDGSQQARLWDLTAPIRVTDDPARA